MRIINKIKNITKLALYVFAYTVLVLIILYGTYIFVQSSVDSNSLVEIFDTKFLAVRTNESEAIVQNGDFVFLESANSCTVQVGDAVAADTSRGIVIGVIKKVVVSNDETSYVLETNPLEAESYVRVVSAKNIEGKIIKKIGNLGTVLSILKQFNFVFIILGILFFCWSLLDMTKIRKQTFEEICIL